MGIPLLVLSADIAQGAAPQPEMTRYGAAPFEELLRKDALAQLFEFLLGRFRRCFRRVGDDVDFRGMLD
jgi:hypothetical protein